jgi:hypothetical protein
MVKMNGSGDLNETHVSCTPSIYTKTFIQFGWFVAHNDVFHFGC